ncbi:MAG: hypothetical protein KGL02_06680, partial [Acidobacteriota bacterium]|nr:hypothetical protein [Acidobacteriota bacterium]
MKPAASEHNRKPEPHLEQSMAAAHQIRPPKLTSADLPPAFHTADRSSLSAQRRFLIAVRFRLTALVAAGAFG